MRKTRPHTWLTLALLIVLTACGGDDDDTGGVVLQTASGATAWPTPAQTSPTPDLSVLRDLPGALVFVQGDRLLLFPHGDAVEPVVIAEHVDPEQLWLRPDGAGMAYLQLAGNEYNQNEVRYVVFDTLETTTLSPRSLGGYSVQSWSPDYEWAVLTLSHIGLTASRLDGSVQHVLSTASGASAHWLDDGSLLVIEDEVPLSGEWTYKRVARFDLAAGLATDLDLDLVALSAAPDTLEAVLAAQDLRFATLPDPLVSTVTDGNTLALAPNRYFYTTPSTGTDPVATQVCVPWEIRYVSPGVDDPVTDTLYAAEDVFKLTDLRRLPDGTLVFLQWTVPDCQLMTLPDIALMLLATDGIAQAVVPGGIFPGVTVGERTRHHVAPRYALSPDGRHVAWVSGSLDSGESALHLTGLYTGDDHLLFAADGDGLTLTAFVEHQLLVGVYWVLP